MSNDQKCLSIGLERISETSNGRFGTVSCENRWLHRPSQLRFGGNYCYLLGNGKANGMVLGLLCHHFSTHVQFVLFRMLWSVRVYGRAPAMWQRSQAIELDKKNNKPGPAGIRLINNLEVLGKWFFSALWNWGTSHAQRYYAFGYVPAKSRIDPIMQQAVLHHRLRHYRISHALSLYDIANAFPSPTRQALSRITRNVAQPSDLDLLQRRHSNAYMSIAARDGAVCLQPGSGSLQGDAVACEQFFEVYHPILDRWRGETQQEELVVADPVSGVAVDVSLTGYADDVARCTVAETSEEMHMLLTNANDVLDKELQSAGMQQNIDKQEHVFFLGAATFVNTISMFIEMACSQGAPKQLRGIWVLYSTSRATTAWKLKLDKQQLHRGTMPWESSGPLSPCDVLPMLFFKQWYVEQHYRGWRLSFSLTLSVLGWILQFFALPESSSAERRVTKPIQICGVLYRAVPDSDVCSVAHCSLQT